MRTLGIGPTDNTSFERTPRAPLIPVPEGARASFRPHVPARAAGDVGWLDLTRRAPGAPRAAGEVIEISGLVRDAAGRPQAGVGLEVWNANAQGRYAHIEDTHDYPLDPHFIGMGTLRTDREGRYRLLTVRPGHYIARPDIDRWRPRHIHMSVLGGAARLVTQMYFEGDPHNDRDPMRILMGDRFARQIGQPDDPTTDAVDAYRFDITVAGVDGVFLE